MRNNLPLVSIIIPCRNEEKHIKKCLDSLIGQDYLKEKMEIIIVDGMSDDGTRIIMEKYLQQYPFIKLLDNLKRITPVALNIGIKNAKGELIAIIGAHAVYNNDYISKCVKFSVEYNTDKVGGILITISGSDSLVNKAINICLSHPFGVGNSYFRTMGRNKALSDDGENNSSSRTDFSKPRLVDAVFGGCYKKEVFEKVGLFNENIARSQDIEFDARLRKAGGKILLVPEILAYYYSDDNFGKFCKHIFSNGFWATYPLKFGIKIFSWRHLIPLFFATGFLLGLFLSFFFWQMKFIFCLILGSYLLLDLFFSIKISAEKGFKYLIILPVIFFSLHFIYGLGSIWGLFKILISKQTTNKK